VSLRGSIVSVTLNGQAAAGFAFAGVTVDGGFGLLAAGAGASFDAVTVKTNDPAVSAAEVAASLSVQDALAARQPAALLTQTQRISLLVEAERSSDRHDWLVDRLWDDPHAGAGAAGEQRDTMMANMPDEGDIEE
jgi:hypothetical protein